MRRVTLRWGLGVVMSLFLAGGRELSAEKNASLEETVAENDLRLQQAKRYAARAQWNAALEEYRHILQQNPTCVAALCQMGEIYLLRLARPQDALEPLHRALALDSENPLAWRLLGTAYFRLNQLEDARDALTKAIALSPEDTQNRYLLGLVYLRRNEIPKAIETFQELLAQNRYDAKTYLSLSQCHEKLGEHELARSALAAFRKLREQEERIETLRLLLAEDPTDVETRLQLVYLHLQREDLPRAAEVLEPCDALAPEDPRVDEAHAVLFLNVGDYAHAAERYQKLVAAHPDVAAYRSGLGVAYLYLEKYPLAIASFKEAIRLEPKDLGFYRNLAEAYRRSGDLLRADEVQRLIQRLSKGSP